VATALAFGVVLLVLVYAIGPISGCHINPAVTLGALLTRRTTFKDAAGYWAAQIVGGILGALLLWGIFANARYNKSINGLGANGYGRESLIRMSGGGAFLAEVVLTAIFVFIVLSLTRAESPILMAGLVIGLSLALVHLIGVPIDGTSVNPARSLGPALVVGGAALSQVWVFLIAPMAGAVVAAGVHEVFNPVWGTPNVITLPKEEQLTEEHPAEPDVRHTT